MALAGHAVDSGLRQNDEEAWGSIPAEPTTCVTDQAAVATQIGRSSRPLLGLH